MKTPKFLLSILFLLNIVDIDAQTNLVFNPSFEDTFCCPIVTPMIECAQYWYQPNPSPDPYNTNLMTSSTDYYNPCLSYQYPPFFPPNQHRVHPRTGIAFAGIWVISEWREYLNGSLKTELKKNSCYNIEIYVIPACFGGGFSGIENIGVYFSKDTLVRDIPSYLTLMPYTPQIKHNGGPICDTMNWTRITGSFVASGGEKHFVIGNFDDDQHTNWTNCRDPLSLDPGGSYYYIDDVSVWPCDAPVYEADAGNDKRICFGDEITIGQNQPDDEYRFLWSAQSHRLTKKDSWDTLSVTPYLTVKPTQTTTYYLWVRDFKMDVTYDSVTVFVDPCMALPIIPNVFTPNGDGFNDVFRFAKSEGWNLQTCIRNRWGELVFEGINDQWWDGTIHGQPASTGVYYYTVTASNPFGQHEILHGVVTVLR
jgi:gliding motility-associated-like protein